MKKVISLKLLIAFFLIVFCIQDSALAQQNKIDSLQAKIEKLQQKVSLLENKVTELEKIFLSKKSTSSSSQSSVNSDSWKNKQNWRKLEKKMSKAEVRQILGEPDRIKASGPIEYWTYPNGGSVDYYNEELSGWSEPLN